MNKHKQMRCSSRTALIEIEPISTLSKLINTSIISSSKYKQTSGTYFATQTPQDVLQFKTNTQTLYSLARMHTRTNAARTNKTEIHLGCDYRECLQYQAGSIRPDLHTSQGAKLHHLAERGGVCVWECVAFISSLLPCFIMSPKSPVAGHFSRHGAHTILTLHAAVKLIWCQIVLDTHRLPIFTLSWR